MVRITEAIFSNGVLKPTEDLHLREQQRVRITIEALDARSEEERQKALSRLLEGQASMSFRSDGPYPSREELHERH